MSRPKVQPPQFIAVTADEYELAQPKAARCCGIPMDTIPPGS